MTKPPEGGFVRVLGEMLRNELGHFEHVDRLLAIEYFLEFIVGVDIALILRILKVVLLDVCPECFYYFRARHRTAANNCLKVAREVHRLHKR